MPDSRFWRGRRVLLTGHTGFKGAWLASWLIDLGCDVHGVSLVPPTQPSLFELNRLSGRMEHAFEDLRCPGVADRAVQRSKPEVVFHLAAQSIVRRGLREPAETFDTNVMGTVRLLDAIRQAPSVRAVVVVTSDKCYAESSSSHGHREEDSLGGRDPYSASKACQEIVAHAYRQSYLQKRLATARAGNVIGGGDWAEDRIIPDAVRAIIDGRNLQVRNPRSIRPWQHVLEPLAGYMRIAEHLCQEKNADGPWNFGPLDEGTATVADVVDLFHQYWGRGSWASVSDPSSAIEAPVLRLDASRAREKLGWKPRISLNKALEMTVDWYKRVLETDTDPYDLTCEQTHQYGSLEAS
jgi:CDP-glucose 4,6-dehydratase